MSTTSRGEGLDTVWTQRPDNEVRELPNGTLVRVIEITRSYNRTDYVVEVLAGSLPAHKETLAAFGGYEPFGGTIRQLGDGTYQIAISGSD